jgi:type IV pilus assembly protein PilM
MAKSAWGIELGTSSVKAVKMSGDRGSATMEEVEILSLRDFGLGAGSTVEVATSAALNDLRARKGIRKGDQIFVSISGQNTLGRIISLPPVSDDRIRETILNEARSQIPIKLEEAVWDYQVIEDTDPDERKVNLYAAKKEAVDRIVGICEAAGIQATGIQVAPLGIYNYIKYEMDDAVSDCCVAIDIGADNTDVILIDGQKTYVRVVPVAGNDITKALRVKFKLPAEQAEKLKRNAAKSKDAAAVFEAMKPPLKEMVGEIYRAVGFYKSLNEDANINQLVMMGNGSKLLNIKKFFEQQLQYQVHKVEAPQRVALARSVDPGEVQTTIQSLTVAIGLSLQGLGIEGLNKINLIPAEYVSAKETEKLRTPFFVGGALAAAGGVLAFVLAFMSVSEVELVRQAADTTEKRASARSSEYNAKLDVQAEETKAYSLKNLPNGRVATIPARKRTDSTGAEIELPEIALTVESAALPGMITAALQSVVAKAKVDPALASLEICYASIRRDGIPGAASMQTATSWMTQTVTPDAPAVEPGQVPLYSVQRTYTFHVYLAVRIDDANQASAITRSLYTNLAESEADGLLWKELRARLEKHFEDSGQLKGVSAEDRKLITYDKRIEASVVQVPIGPQGWPLREIVPVSGGAYYNNGAPVPTSTTAPNVVFGVSDVTIKITLDGIKPPAPDAQ